MKRIGFAAAALSLLVLLVACGEQADQSGDDGQANDSTPTARPDPTETEIEQSAPAEDPREVAAELIQARMEDDSRMVYDRLVPRAQVVEFEESWVDRMLSSAAVIIDEIPEDPEDWQVEHYDDFVVVRDRDLPLSTLVFRPIDGEWRWDPGDRLIGQAWYSSLPASARETSQWMLPQVHREAFESWKEADNEEIMFGPLEWGLYTLAERDEGPELTFTVNVSRAMTESHDELLGHITRQSTVDLDSVQWQAGGETGATEVAWTDAKLEDEELILPASPEPDDQGFVPQQYMVTFRLLDFPDEVDEATLEIGEILIGPFGDEAPAYQDEPYPVSVGYNFPVETTPEVLSGEAPDVDAPETPEAGESIPHEELPSNEVDDVFEVEKVTYERADDAVRADLVIDTGEEIPLQPGGEILIEWDDGHQSETRLLWQDGAIQLGVERTEPPYDTEIVEVTFVDLMTRRLERDEDATLYEDRIETKWGDFPILEIAEANNQASVYYQPAGRRWPEFVVVEQNGQTAALSGQPSWDRNYQLEPAQMTGDAAFVDMLDEFPVPAVVQVRQVDVDATMMVD